MDVMHVLAERPQKLGYHVEACVNRLQLYRYGVALHDELLHASAALISLRAAPRLPLRPAVGSS